MASSSTQLAETKHDKLVVGSSTTELAPETEMHDHDKSDVKENDDQRKLMRETAEMQDRRRQAMKEKIRVQDRLRTAAAEAAYERQVRRAMKEKARIEERIRRAKEAMAALQRFLGELTKAEFHYVLRYSTKEKAKFQGRLADAETESARKTHDITNSDFHGLFREAMKEKAQDVFDAKKTIQGSLGKRIRELGPQVDAKPDQESRKTE